MAEQIYDRITEVLTPFTGIEFISADILENAAQRGTEVHKFIEGVLKGWEFHVEHGTIKPYIDSFRTFWEKSNHAFEGGKIILEERLYCDKHRITGQADVIIKMKDRTYIIDWKTSSAPQKSWHLQGAAYKYLCEVNGYSNVDDVLFVKLNNDGKAPSLHKSSEHKDNLETFFKCLDLYRWFNMKNTRNKWQ